MRQPKINNILISFSHPNTPKCVEKALGIKKLKLNPFIMQGLLKCLNPCARKGRLYVLTEKGRNLINLRASKIDCKLDWDLIGWILASPKQRLVVLSTIALDSVERTSENIRVRASNLNSRLTRISTKSVLRELTGKNLVKTEMIDRRRYYWVSEKGSHIINNIESQMKI